MDISDGPGVRDQYFSKDVFNCKIVSIQKRMISQ